MSALSERLRTGFHPGLPATKRPSKHVAVAGQVFGRLTVESVGMARGYRVALCACDCGAAKLVRIEALCKGTSSCGCLVRDAASARAGIKTGPGYDLVGRRFGRWLVERVGTQTPGQSYLWVCVCDCGNRREVQGAKLLAGKSRSCSCVKTHGQSKTPTYRIWCGMRRRCEDINEPAYKRYGARGIKVCERWQNYEAFLADMGPRPTRAHSIDRFPNGRGNYEPGNCRWATATEQSRNRYTNRMLTLGSETMCARDWAERLGINPFTLNTRLQLGWSTEAALTTPVRQQGAR
jgi:hypothetical protein